MKLPVAVIVVMALGTSAYAGKPSKSVAKAVATKWAAAIVKSDADKPETLKDAVDLTSTAFHVAVYDSTDFEASCEATVTKPEERTDALACARKGPIYTPLKPYSSKILKKVWGWMYENKAEIAKLAKTYQVFVYYAEGEDIAQIAIIAVGMDPDNVPRVAVVYASELTT